MTQSISPISWPIDPRLISRVGESVELQRRGSGRPHKGIDLFAREGTPVRAAAAGVVLRVVDGTTSGATKGLKRAGWFVDIADPRGSRVFRYLHLAANPVVKAGQAVAELQPIAAVGASGVERAGTHVHFEIRSSDWDRESRQYGPPIDPLSLLAPRETTSMANSETAEQAIAVKYLVAQGWTEAAARELLTRKRDDPAKITADQLGALGWSKDEIARFIGGPAKAAKTAEGLYRALAGAPSDTRAAFNSILEQGGAGEVSKPEVNTSSRKVAASPKQTDLAGLLTQFTDLPPDQQKRFLSLLSSQGGSTDTPKKKAPNIDLGVYGPLIQGGVDAVLLALKKLLGSDSGGKGGGKGPAKSSEGGGKQGSTQDADPSEGDSGNTDPGGGHGVDNSEQSNGGGSGVDDPDEPTDTPEDTDKAEIEFDDDRSDLPDTDTDIGVIDYSPEDEGLPETDTDIGVIEYSPDDEVLDLPESSTDDNGGAPTTPPESGSSNDTSEPD